ncbi:MAG: polysulfide reductase NrfD [Chloroflexi bacterium]|nr:polysulfide reductase NrfD [Chloroflexota bacterium]
MVNAARRQDIKGKLVFLWFAGLSVVILAGVIAGYHVFTKGLVITNLTDLVPWGLWITIDLSSIAMAAGAFSICAVVYLVGLKKYEPIARTATFVGFVGYSMAMLCLLMDIGRPDRFWHGFVFWNPHSVLWEVTMCVGLYFSVLSLEILPIIGQTDWLRKYVPGLSEKLVAIHHYAPVLAIFGLGFSLLHQSSLGGTYGVLQARPAWYRPNLSVLFIYSAVLGGVSMTLFVSMLASRISSKARVDDSLIEQMAHFIGWALLGYLYFRFWDTFSVSYTYQPGRSEAFALLTKGSLAISFWFGEVIFGMVVPVFILLKAKLRRNPTLRMVALGMIAAGVIAYRWDVNLMGQLVVLTYLPQEIAVRYASYTPSLVEILTGAGVIAYGMFAVSVGVLFFNVVDHYRVEHDVVEHLPQVVSHDGALPQLAE